MDDKYDLLAIGEALIDFTQDGISLSGQRLFEQNAGGAPANVACAVARLGGKAGFVGKVGKDMHGEYLLAAIAAAGVDVSGMVLDQKAFTTLAFVALDAAGERSFCFARKPGADTMLRVEDLRPGQLERAYILHCGSLPLTNTPSRDTTLYAVRRAKEAGAIVSYDPNYRASLWSGEEEARRWMRTILPFADIVKLSDTETALLTGKEAPEEAAQHLLEQGVACVAVTRGARGAYVRNKYASCYCEAFAVEAIDTTGAGDAFCGGFLTGLIKDRIHPEALKLAHIKRYARLGNATAALCIQRRGGIPAMPDAADVLRFLEAHVEPADAP